MSHGVVHALLLGMLIGGASIRLVDAGHPIVGLGIAWAVVSTTIAWNCWRIVQAIRRRKGR